LLDWFILHEHYASVIVRERPVAGRGSDTAAHARDIKEGEQPIMRARALAWLPFSVRCNNSASGEIPLCKSVLTLHK
jgi:hypothetical protein